VVAVRAAGQQPQVGVGGLGAGARQAVGDGVEDQLPVALDRLGELDERWETASLGPREPADEQRRRGGQITGLEDRPELLFQEVGAVERPVGGLDAGQGAALVKGQRVGAFSAAPTGCS